MALPNTSMDAVPFTPLTAEFLDDMIENIEYLGDILDGTSPTGPDGWNLLSALNPTITYNGNHSYNVVYPGVNYTGLTSPGSRLKFTRTVTAPTQCADLEASSSQYFSKTSPAGLSFTTTFTCSAWIKLESYTLGGVIGRRNADTEGWGLRVNANGTVALTALRIADNTKVITSYQSVPLNKWVHIAATMDVSAGDTTTQKIWIDGVEVPRVYNLTGVCTALVQGTTALTVGAEKSTGTNPFDGKIAQAAVFSSQLSDATIKAMMNQTMTGSETNLVSAFTLNNTLNDLSANANNLTAQGSAVATNADTPFTNDVTGTSITAGTTNYGIIMAQTFSTNTTYTIQIPEGETLPTTGGIGVVSYSTQKTPYGFTGQKNKWSLETIIKNQISYGVGTAGTWYNTGFNIYLPVGDWSLAYYATTAATHAGVVFLGSYIALSESSSAETDQRFRLTSTNSNASLTSAESTISKEAPVSQTTAGTWYFIMSPINSSTTQLVQGSSGNSRILAYNGYL